MNADNALKRYVQLLGQLDGQALDPFPTIGERCSHCGNGPSTRTVRGWVRRRGIKPDPMADSHWESVCATCRKPWKGEAIRETRLHGGRRVSPDEKLVELSSLGVMIDSLDIWQRRVLVLVVICDLPKTEAARQAAERWPCAPFVWHDQRVGRLLRMGRQNLQALLDAADEPQPIEARA